ncbi:MAG: hypothetical protein E6I52_13250 [Chloroflexi bacterium]|nr:MAG: hypothetical protein E6I52_13250 [Chloroflexota bacterium]
MPSAPPSSAPVCASAETAAAELWNSHRRMLLPGIVQYFVNDLRGRPLLVVTEEVRAIWPRACRV